METSPTIDYAAVLADLEKRRDDLDKAIAVLKNVIGTLSSAATGNVFPASPAEALSALGNPNSDIVIGTDAFFGMNIVTAAQKYLMARKKPATAAEIAEALEAGGFPHQSASLANTVNSVITRNSQGSSPVFAKVKRGIWGLRAWYPNYRPKDDKGED